MICWRIRARFYRKFSYSVYVLLFIVEYFVLKFTNGNYRLFQNKLNLNLLSLLYVFLDLLHHLIINVLVLVFRLVHVRLSLVENHGSLVRYLPLQVRLSDPPTNCAKLWLLLVDHLVVNFHFRGCHFERNAFVMRRKLRLAELLVFGKVIVLLCKQLRVHVAVLTLSDRFLQERVVVC